MEYQGMKESDCEDTKWRDFEAAVKLIVESGFEQVCQTQSTRIIPDIHLRAQLHELILSTLLPAYKSFLEKLGRHIKSERYKDRYIKYSSEDLQNKVQNFFLEYLIVPNGATGNIIGI